jgi:hypothetical protein
MRPPPSPQTPPQQLFSATGSSARRTLQRAVHASVGGEVGGNSAFWRQRLAVRDLTTILRSPQLQ